MFKKILKYTLSILLICVLLTGCTNQTTQAQVGKNLDKKLSNLYNTVKNLDTIDNNYISNPDLHITNKSTNLVKNIDNLSTISMKNYNINKLIKFDNETDKTNKILQDLLVKELERRISLNNNGYCNNCENPYNCDENGYCNNCGDAILCDENGNCTYCNKKIILNKENKCNSCNKSYLVNKISSEKTDTIYDDVDILDNDSILKTNDGQYSITPLTTNTEEQIVESENIEDLKTQETEIESNVSELIEEDYNSLDKTKNNDTSNSYEDENKINTINSEMDDNNHNIISDSIDIEKQKNSNKTSNNNDDNIANNENSNIKVYYYTNDSFSPIKLRYNPRFVSNYNENDINQQLSNYLYKVQRLYAMTEDALEANNILNTTKQELLGLIKEIRNLNESILNGTCTATIQQLQALSNYTHDLKNTIKNLKKCNGDLENEVSNINSNIPTTIASSVDVMNSNYVKLINLIDTRITYHESAISTLEQIKYLLEEAISNSNISEEEVKDIIEQLSNTEQENIETSQENLQSENEDKTTNIEIKIIDENEAKNYTDNIEIITKDDNENILDNNDVNNDEDAFGKENVVKKTTSIKNIDTYKTPSNNEVDYDIVPNNNFVKNNIANNENEYIVNNPNTPNTTTNTDNNTTDFDNNFNITDNNSPNTGNNSTIINNSTINDNIYKNSVINQNNLNNNDGYGGYYYANDGQIHNNGINNNNEYGNNGNTIENNLNRNNNTNTYGYNTMLDIINQGTVNNGINTL